MSAELQTVRGRTFFWIGMAVFPVFWLWWMNARQFTLRQIHGARLWTGLYVVAVIVGWWVSPAFRSRVAYLPWNYAYIAFQVGVVLWVWLLFRTIKISENFLGFLMCLDVLGMLFGQFVPLSHSLPAHPTSLLFIVIPAAAHLVVEPWRRHQARLISHLPWYSLKPDMETEMHERVDVAGALEIAERYWEGASGTFGFGWADQFIEFCICSQSRISCTLRTAQPAMLFFKRTREQREELCDREAMVGRIREFYACTAEQLHQRKKA